MPAKKRRLESRQSSKAGHHVPQYETDWVGRTYVGCPICNRWKVMKADRKSTRLNSSHGYISYAVFCLKKKKAQYEARAPLPWHRIAAAAAVTTGTARRPRR